MHSYTGRVALKPCIVNLEFYRLCLCFGFVASVANLFIGNVSHVPELLFFPTSCGAFFVMRFDLLSVSETGFLCCGTQYRFARPTFPRKVDLVNKSVLPALALSYF